MIAHKLYYISMCLDNYLRFVTNNNRFTKFAPRVKYVHFVNNSDNQRQKNNLQRFKINKLENFEDRSLKRGPIINSNIHKLLRPILDIVLFF